jgi:hypothetical protein
MRREEKRREEKTRQDKTRQDKTREEKRREGDVIKRWPTVLITALGSWGKPVTRCYSLL